MATTREQLLSVAKSLSFDIPEDQIQDYEELLARTKKTLETVAAMDDYQPPPNYTTTPRTNIHFPSPKDNPLGAWAWRFHLTSTSPTTTTLTNKTLCLKDNICVAGIPCLLGTTTFTNWTPTTDATVVTRILAAAGTITGKAVCENLSRGAISNSAATGPVHNPHAHGYSVGGSSSGTAAAVAAGDVDMGIGCDQGGSIRIPAALTGLVGFKATSGLVPYTGIVSNDASLDYVGPITKSVVDCAVLLRVVAGADGVDDRCGAGVPFPEDVPAYDGLMKEGGIKGMRIGVLREGVPEGIDKGVEARFREAVKVFEALGAVVVEVSVPLHASARGVYSVVSKMGNHMGMLGKATGRRQAMLTDLFEKKGLPYTPEVFEKMAVMSREGLLSGEFAWQNYSTLYPKAVNIMRKLKDQYNEILSSVDVIVMPTTLCPANRLPPADATPVVQMDAAKGMTDNTCAFNATGHPALAMPIGFVAAKEDEQVRLPASMQIVGKWYDEVTVLKFAYAWEQAINWRECK
ncbi:amidase signature domain-containing protein [Aspergillus karnatakaensis]|uniref:amidase signature domain-containing protein n=1 Tax=Aspergillus karnatakaensis TaxID=1810916 RepID=UPI003CCCDF7A